MTASSSARSARATARTSATPSRRRAKASRLGHGQRAQPRADPLLHRREPLRPRRRVRRAARGPHRRAPRQGAGRGRRGRRAALHLRRLGRQVRGRRPQAAVPRPGARHERAGRRGRHRRARGRPRSSPFVTLMAAAITAGNTARADPVGDRARCSPPTSTRCSTPRDVPGGVVNIVTGDRDEARPGTGRSTTPSTRSGPSARATMAEAFEKASAGNLKQTWCETVARDWSDDRISAGRDIARPRDAGQERLDSVRGVDKIAGRDGIVSAPRERHRECSAHLRAVGTSGRQRDPTEHGGSGSAGRSEPSPASVGRGCRHSKAGRAVSTPCSLRSVSG